MVNKLERFLQERIDNYRGLMDECVEAGTDENGYALAVEALQRVQQDAARIATPTEDARERVKVLEAFVREYVRVWEAGTGTVYLIDQARTALGNKETERHG